MKNPWLLWRSAHERLPIQCLVTAPKLTGNVVYHVSGHYFGGELGPFCSQTDVYTLLDPYTISIPGMGRPVVKSVFVPVSDVSKV